jgi:hypothetical protein
VLVCCGLPAILLTSCIGALNYSSQVTVQPGTSTACLAASASSIAGSVTPAASSGTSTCVFFCLSCRTLSSHEVVIPTPQAVPPVPRPVPPRLPPPVPRRLPPPARRLLLPRLRECLYALLQYSMTDLSSSALRLRPAAPPRPLDTTSLLSSVSPPPSSSVLNSISLFLVRHGKERTFKAPPYATPRSLRPFCFRPLLCFDLLLSPIIIFLFRLGSHPPLSVYSFIYVKRAVPFITPQYDFVASKE